MLGLSIVSTGMTLLISGFDVSGGVLAPRYVFDLKFVELGRQLTYY